MVYRAKPVDAAAYVQAVIEYDFLTVRLGGRFDYGVAKGLGFTNPFDPSNGTTARQICEGATVAGNRLVNAQGQPYGTAGCFASPVNPATKRPSLLDSAAKLAQLDDFTEAKARTAFSPRIGVNFPLTERSQIFFNAGRYTKVPNYGDVYRNTGIGTVAGLDASSGQDRYCAAGQTKPGTNECVPDIRATNPTYIGNPNLLLEEAKAYEVGYSTTLGANNNYGFSMAMWNRAETGLTAVRNSRAVQDIGSTYDGSAPTYTVLVNGDFLTARGLELNLDRRLANRWSYGVNYGLSRATTNGRPPEKAEELDRNQANRVQLIEALIESDVTHAFNLQGSFRVMNDIPQLKWNLGRFLRNTNVNATYQFTSGIPYTPVRATSLGTTTSTNNAAENLSGRQPSVQTVNLMINKAFSINNVSYSAFFRVQNLLDRKNCNQVFPNTGTCKSGLRDFGNRSIGNTGDVTSSTGFDQPEYIGARRSLFTGISVNF
jgi:outer membrane receptor protein involved in Fe transport